MDARKMSFMRGITSRLMAKKWNADKASFCSQKIIEQAYDQSNSRYT